MQRRRAEPVLGGTPASSKVGAAMLEAVKKELTRSKVDFLGKDRSEVLLVGGGSTVRDVGAHWGGQASAEEREEVARWKGGTRTVLIV